MDAQTAGLRDGEAGALERSAGDAATASPSTRGGRASGDVLDPARGRRAVIEAALAEKILRSHLHNSLQTSFPLVLNLANQSAAEADVLLRIAAAAILSGANPAGRARTAQTLASVGAGPEAVARFETMLADPSPLPGLVAAIADAGLAAHAYAVALVVLPRPSASEDAFLGYLAARLGLGAEVVAGINRRYRR